ncbi:MAG: pyrroline-5-carboxylate reductase [Actinomycetota bacterium]
MTTVALLGGGKMGTALLAGLIGAGWSPADCAVAEIDDDRRAVLGREHPGIRVTAEAVEVAHGADVVVVAVKPGAVAATLGSAATGIGPAVLVVSIAAGVRIAAIEAAVPGRPVVRAMPNTPAVVGLGASAIAGGTHAGPEHLDLAERVLGAVGTVVRVEEPMLDAVTGLSGSGPAYVFLLAEALMAGGARCDLPPEVVRDLVVQTVLGAATLLASDPAGPAALRAAVTSPGGTTEAAIRELEARGVPEAIAAAVEVATRRSRELGA